MIDHDSLADALDILKRTSSTVSAFVDAVQKGFSHSRSAEMRLCAREFQHRLERASQIVAAALAQEEARAEPLRRHVPPACGDV